MEKSIMTDEGIEIISSPEKVDMADDWYEFANLQHFWIQARFSALKRHLKNINLKGSSLFEVGCGNGLIMNQFEGEYGGKVDGCDLNLFALKQARGHQGKLYCLNIFEHPQFLQKKYDGVLLMDVIEHIDNDSAFLRAAIQYVNDDGIVVINVPAINQFFSRYDVAAGHKRRYNKEMMHKLLAENNIVPLAISYWGFSLVPIVLLRKWLLKIMGSKNTIRNGFKPPNELMNRLFKVMLSAEMGVLKSPWVGTSLIAIGKVKRDA